MVSTTHHGLLQTFQPQREVMLTLQICHSEGWTSELSSLNSLALPLPVMESSRERACVKLGCQGSNTREKTSFLHNWTPTLHGTILVERRIEEEEEEVEEDRGDSIGPPTGGQLEISSSER